ncbi:MAG: transcriptional repressor [Deltaproteobacteria bacterium]|nr:transcriptional repressor [Deltaproteobacteria bacterium]
MTHQRQVILDEIQKAHDHLTADEIYARVRKRLPRISLGTVYRNLDLLATCGFINRFGSEYPQMRFDGNTREHYHVICTRCGCLEDAPFEPSDNDLENLENALGRLTRYGVFGHKIEFFGLCRACMEREKEEKRLETMDETIHEGGIT